MRRLRAVSSGFPLFANVCPNLPDVRSNPTLPLCHLTCLLQYFVLDVVVNFSRLSEDDLFTQLDRIATVAEEEAENAELVGILTAAYRDKWATARMHLMEGKKHP